MLVNDWNAKNKRLLVYRAEQHRHQTTCLYRKLFGAFHAEGHLEASTHTPLRPLAIPVDRRTTGRWVHMVQHHLRVRMKVLIIVIIMM